MNHKLLLFPEAGWAWLLSHVTKRILWKLPLHVIDKERHDLPTVTQPACGRIHCGLIFLDFKTTDETKLSKKILVANIGMTRENRHSYANYKECTLVNLWSGGHFGNGIVRNHIDVYHANRYDT